MRKAVENSVYVTKNTWSEVWLRGLGAILLILCCASPTYGAWHTWTGTDGVWDDAANWDQATYPGGDSGDYAVINNGIVTMATGNIIDISGGWLYVARDSGTSGNVHLSGGNITANQIRVGSSAGDSGGNILMTGGNLSADRMYLGNGGSGEITMSGGNLIIGPTTFNLANGAGAFARMNVSGGHLSISGYSQIGAGGEGYLTISGGEHIWSNDIRLGSSGGTGNMIFSNADLTTSNEWIYIGESGSGTGYLEVRSGNIDTGTGRFEVASSAGCNGTVHMSGGNLSTTILYSDSGGSGNVLLSGGNLSTGGFYTGYNAGGTSRFVQTGGDLNVSGYTVIGRNGIGYLDITGGQQNWTDHMRIGEGAGTGNVTVSAGNMNISTKFIYVGKSSNGSLTLNGGNIQVSRFYIGNDAGSEGTAVMSGGNLDSERLYVGNSGSGNFLFSGGTFDVDTWFQIGCLAGASGRFLQTDGDINIGININIATNGPGTLAITGGNLTCSTIDANTSDATFSVTGPSANVVCSTYNNDSADATFQAILDRNSGHFTPVRCTSNLNMEGHFKMGLNGGILLSSDNTFEIMYGEGVTNTFASVSPHWDLSTANNVYGSTDVMSVTMAAGNLVGTLDMGNSLVRTAVSSVVAGHFKLTNIGSSSRGLHVLLQVQSGTAATVLAKLTAAGYDASLYGGTSDIVVKIPASDITAGTGYFQWDFSDIDTGVSYSSLQNIQIGVPPIGVMFYIE